MDTILIVGAGFGQIPAIEIAKCLGYKTLVVDRDISAPGMTLADISSAIDVLDIDAVINIAKQHFVCGALTMQSDIGVPTVGAVVDALQLAGCGYDVAERCSNKILTREAFAKHGVPQPDFRIVSDEKSAKEAAHQVGYPCVIKAPDSSGSRGVVKVHEEAEVPIAFIEAKKFTSGNKLLVEEFIGGHEVGAQAFSVGGQCVKVLVHDDDMSEPPYMIPIAHGFPSSLAEGVLYKCEVAVKACVEALGIKDGPANIDLIIDTKEQPRIIEVGARIGATCLPELVNYHTGIDWTGAAIQAACGIQPNLKETRKQPCAAYILQSPTDGILESYEVPKIYSNNPDILEWEVTAPVGSRVSRLRKGTDRIGKVVTRGQTTIEAMELARSFRDAIQWKIKSHSQDGQKE